LAGSPAGEKQPLPRVICLGLEFVLFAVLAEKSGVS
jgi:hypothetical protein